MKVLLRVDRCGLRPDGTADVGLAHFQQYRARSGLAGRPVVWAFRPELLTALELSWLSLNLPSTESVALCGFRHEGVEPRGVFVPSRDDVRRAACKMTVAGDLVGVVAGPGECRPEWCAESVPGGLCFVRPGRGRAAGGPALPYACGGAFVVPDRLLLCGPARKVYSEMVRGTMSGRWLNRPGSCPVVVAIDAACRADSADGSVVSSLGAFLRDHLVGAGYVRDWCRRTDLESLDGPDADLYRWAVRSCRPFSRVLDAGCGSSPIPVQLALRGCRVVAVDRDNRAVEAQKVAADAAGVSDNLEARWLDLSNARSLSYLGSEDFDAVLDLRSSCHNLSGDSAAAMRLLCARVIRDGGILLSAMPVGDEDMVDQDRFRLVARRGSVPGLYTFSGVRVEPSDSARTFSDPGGLAEAVVMTVRKYG